MSREGRQAKRNPGLARARRLLKPALFVTSSEFHWVPFGPVPAGLFRYGVGPVMVWLFRFCKRPNGMEVGFSLLSLWLLVAEEAGLNRRIRCGTQCRKSPLHSVWPKEPRINTQAHAGNGSGQAVSREGRQAKRNPGLARARRLLKPALFVTASEFHGVPFGRNSHASTRQGTQATVRASSVSRGRAGQTESGTRKGTWVVEACVIRHCQ